MPLRDACATQPPTAASFNHQSQGADVAPASNCNSVNSLHCTVFLTACVIAGRVAQSMVTRPMYILRLILLAGGR